MAMLNNQRVHTIHCACYAAHQTWQWADRKWFVSDLWKHIIYIHTSEIMKLFFFNRWYIKSMMDCLYLKYIFMGGYQPSMASLWLHSAPLVVPIPFPRPGHGHAKKVPWTLLRMSQQRWVWKSGDIATNLWDIHIIDDIICICGRDPWGLFRSSSHKRNQT